VLGRGKPHREVDPRAERASTVAVVVFGVVMLALTITALVAALVS
jgi:hypothetical protein